MTLVPLAEEMVLSDFVIIRHNQLVRIGDDPTKPDDPKDSFGNTILPQPELKQKFLAEFRWPMGGAVLTLNVSQLTASQANVPIFINGKPIGEICRYFGAETRQQRAWEYWYSQTICFRADVLNESGDNEIVIPRSPIDPKKAEPAFDDEYDDFFIKDVVLWYKQMQGGWFSRLQRLLG